MKVSELKKILEQSKAITYNKPGYDEEVVVTLTEKSIGALATEAIQSASFGFDWNQGKLLLHTKSGLIRKPLDKKRSKKTNTVSDLKILRNIYKNLVYEITEILLAAKDNNEYDVLKAGLLRLQKLLEQ